MPLGKCNTCGKESKYKCPACSILSCSLNCVKVHKQKSPCTGELDTTAFLPKKDLLTTTALDRDYNFLQHIGRQITLEKNDARTHRVVKPRDQWRAGARVHCVGKHMSRNKKNHSKWNNQGKYFEWTIEIRKQGSITYSQLPDKTLVSDIPAQFQSPSDMNVVLIDCYGSTHILDKNLTFQDAIRGKNILEFPTIEFVPASENDTTDSDSSSDSDSDDEVSSDSGSDDENNAVDAKSDDIQTKSNSQFHPVPPQFNEQDSESDTEPVEESTKIESKVDSLLYSIV